MPDPEVQEMCASIFMNASLADQDEAMKRYLAICQVLALVRTGGLTMSAAVIEAAVRVGVHDRTVWRWLYRVDQLNHSSSVWLCALLPRPLRRKPHPEHKHLVERHRMIWESADA